MAKIKLSDIFISKFYEVWKAIKAHLYTHYYFTGGRISTKSSFISLVIILLLISDEEANAVIFRKVAETLSGSVFEQMLWAINILGLSDYFQAKKSPQEIIYKPTGQKILFKGLDDAGKTKSMKLRKGLFKIIWFEELDEFKNMREIRKAIQSAQRGNKDADFWIFYSFNPPAATGHWANKEVKIPRKDKLVTHSCYLDVPADWIPKQVYIEAEELKKVDEAAYRNEYLGEVTGVGGLVFPKWQIYTDADEPKSFDDVIMGMDFGYNHPTALVKCSFKEDRAYIREILYQRHYTTGEIIGLMKDLKVSKKLDIIGDSAEPDRIKEIWDADYQIRGAVKSEIVASINVVKRYKLYIHEDSKNLQEELSSYHWKADVSGEPLDKIEPNKQHDDAIAAVRYAVQYYDKLANQGSVIFNG